MPYTDNGTGYANQDTSLAAAEQIEPFTPTIRDQVLAIIKLRGNLGLTADEAATGLGIDKGSVRPRGASTTRLASTCIGRQYL